MIYDIKNVNISSKDLDKYLDSLINRVFAILGVYEDCTKLGNFENYSIYLDRVLIELKGFSELVDTKDFISLYNILYGLMCLEDLGHKKVKSIVFHCISVIKKYKSGD